MDILEQTRKILGDSITNSTDLDVKMLPLNLRTIFRDCIKPMNENVPDESLLLDLLVKISQLISLNRTHVVSQIGTTLINMYAVIFMPSGSGKDKPLKLIDKHFMKTFEENFHRKREAYQERRLKELQDEAEEKFGGKAATAKKVYIENSLPRVLVPEISNGTMEGLADLRQVLYDAKFGGTFLKISEFSDFITSNNNARSEFLTFIVELFDDGSSLAKIIKSDKQALPVKGVPSNIIMHSSIAKLVESEGYSKLMTLIDRGLARRSFLCYPSLDKFYYQQKDDSLESMFKKFISSNEATEQKIKDYQSMWEEAYEGTKDGKTYVLTREADFVLFAYKKYLEEVSNKISTTKEEGFRAEVLGRFWKTLKLAGLIAVWEHPGDLKVTEHDVLAAVYLAELYGQHYKRFYQIETVTDSERVADYMIDRVGEWITRGDIKKQRFVAKNNFAKWFEDTMPEVETILIMHEYRLEAEPFAKNGTRYRAVKLEKTDLTKMKVSVSKDITEGYIVKEVPFSELHKIVTADINYSASEFKDGYRKKENFIDGNNVIILDIDEGWSVQDAKEFLEKKKLKALIATTKSHQKVKDKKPACDRFRIILPTLSPFKGSNEEYSFMMSEIFKYFEGKPDKAAKDSSRFYYGNTSGEYWYIDGDLLNIEMFPRSTPKNPIFKVRKDAPTSFLGITDWFKQNAVPGSRNETLYKAKKFADDQGLDAAAYVREINAMLPDPLDEKEIKIIIRDKS